jgi:hypothetical protein
MVLLALVASATTGALAAAESEAATKAWIEAMTPGEAHQRLAERVGEWKAVVTMWEAPGAEPVVIEGVALKSMVLGGRFLHEEFSSTYNGQLFRGVGITGYDNVTGEYSSIWYDTAGTAIHVSKGRAEAGNRLAWSSTGHDPVTRRQVRLRSTSSVTDADHHAFESYRTRDDGSEFLQMRVEYTRSGR